MCVGSGTGCAAEGSDVTGEDRLPSEHVQCIYERMPSHTHSYEDAHFGFKTEQVEIWDKQKIYSVCPVDRQERCESQGI